MLRTGTNLFFLMLSLLTPIVLAANSNHNNPQLDVFVYNDVKLATPELARAEAQAANILGRAGLEVVWENCHDLTGVSDYGNLPELLLRIMSGPINSVDDSAFGVAFLSADGSGRYGDIFYQRAMQLHEDWGVSLGDTLGAVMAHEIGHLLLGSNSHAPVGIMRAHWQGEELRMLARGALLFTAEQARRMRASLSRTGRNAEARLAERAPGIY
jgi:hypothetical protein